MSDDGDPFVVLSWPSESSVFESGDPDDFLFEADGNVLSVDNDDGRSLVGKFRVYHVDVERAMNEHMSVFDVFDAHSHTAGYYEAIFGNSCPDFSDQVMKLLRYNLYGSNILILDRLELIPKYRGRGLGLRNMRHMMKRFGPRTALIAIKPFPLQFEHESSNEDDKKWRAKL